MSILGYINKRLWLLKWKMKKKELKNCGNDCYMGKNFNLKSHSISQLETTLILVRIVKCVLLILIAELNILIHQI